MHICQMVVCPLVVVRVNIFLMFWNVLCRSHDLDALETTGWEPLSTQYKKKLLTLMYKVNCRITSDKITNLFSIANPHYNLRNSNHFALPRFNLDTGRNSIRYRGPIAWATTPTCLKHATSLKNFKKLLKQRRHKLFIKNISFGKEACMVSHKDQDFTYSHIFNLVIFTTFKLIIVFSSLLD